MAKKDQEETKGEFTENAATDPAPAAPAEGAAAVEAKTDETVDGRHIMITDPTTGQPIKRVDFIKREVIQKGRQRGDVAKELTKIQGKKVPYQIVFAATKGFKPKKPETTSTSSTDGAAAAGAETASAE